jgi:hypothetical protein
MSKKEYCQKNPAVAYYSGFNGLEIHGIEYGIDDYIYCVSGAWGSPKNYGYHKLEIKYDRHGNGYFIFHGYKCLLSDCIKMNGGF